MPFRYSSWRVNSVYFYTPDPVSIAHTHVFRLPAARTAAHHINVVFLFSCAGSLEPASVSKHKPCTHTLHHDRQTANMEIRMWSRNWFAANENKWNTQYSDAISIYTINIFMPSHIFTYLAKTSFSNLFLHYLLFIRSLPCGIHFWYCSPNIIMSSSIWRVKLLFCCVFWVNAVLVLG